MKTFDNHLTGVTANQPHPESYRPDLPLLCMGSEERSTKYDEGYDDGYDDGYRTARADARRKADQAATASP